MFGIAGSPKFSATNALPGSINNCTLWFDCATKPVFKSGPEFVSIMNRRTGGTLLTDVNNEPYGWYENPLTFRDNIPGFSSNTLGATGDGIINFSPIVCSSRICVFVAYKTNVSSGPSFTITCGGGSGMSLGVNNGRSFVYDGNAVTVTSVITVNDGQLHSSVFLFNNTVGGVYDDGVLMNVAAISNINGESFSSFNINSLDAAVCEFAYFDRNISTQEVQMLHQYAVNRWK